jgi:putative Mn2+ efflux pump MntP
MIATAILFLSLGLDTLAVAFGFGLAGLPRSQWLRLGLTLALFEAGLPVLGVLVGQRLGGVLGEVAAYAAAGLLVLIGLLSIREAMAELRSGLPARSAADEAAEDRPILVTGLSVGLDELAIGLSLGILDVPLGPALGYVAVQAVVLSMVGLSLGQHLGARLGQRAELAAGVALTLVGLALLINEATGAHVL